MVGEQRTGRRMGADGRDDELFSCLRIESRGTDDAKLLESDPMDRLTVRTGTRELDAVLGRYTCLTQSVS